MLGRDYLAMFDPYPLIRKNSRYDLNSAIDLLWGEVTRRLFCPMILRLDGEVAGQVLIIMDLSLHAALISDKLRKRHKGRFYEPLRRL